MKSGLGLALRRRAQQLVRMRGNPSAPPTLLHTMAANDCAGDDQIDFQESLEEKEREALEVIKTDLCEWLSYVLETKIEPNSFMKWLSSGVELCKLANKISRKVSDVQEINWTTKEGLFFARDNVSNFIKWCKGIGVEEAVLFESNDLVLDRNEKQIILCLMEVSRYASKVGISPPKLVKMEQEIDHFEKHGSISPPKQKKRKTEVESPEDKVNKCGECSYTSHCNLQVMNILEKCLCKQKLKVTNRGSGKFILVVGEKRFVIYARVCI